MPGQTRPRTYMAARRLELRVQQGTLADAIGVTIPLIAFMEKGRARCVTASNRAVIADMLNLPVSTLFDDRGVAKPLPGETTTVFTPSPLSRRMLDRIRVYTERGWSRARMAEALGVTTYRIAQAQSELGLLQNYRGVPLESYTGTTGSNPEVSGHGREDSA